MDLKGLETIWGPRVLGLLRIVTALLFMEHGGQKLLGFPPTDHPLPALFTLLWFAGILELFGGFLVLIGLFTRPIAFLLSGEMAFAYWTVHAPRSFYPALNGGDASILFCFVFFYLAVVGAGAFSIDGLRNKSAAA